jgi:hypothetical protein
MPYLDDVVMATTNASDEMAMELFSSIAKVSEHQDTILRS